ncbi:MULTISPECIES: hypothetical protein [unclassified Paraburkholderia]|uniref:hypothetical protein n=1 Tax=unclassified Paraburkholderia TaxID=2615204 RepID=UPI001609CE06|nr:MULTISPECIES: hypothetical protein [unclassified Paraburkholderia]MBB5446884.1 hypothetical protein [Paraburkholderia sp. WSM4177]MBB5487464.1 hypothetical protein [Paraburkholderia sp. WSM4180]
MKHHWRRFITWMKEIADPELAELSRRTRHQISSQFLVDALMNTVAKRRAGEIEFGHIKMVVSLCPDSEKNPQVYAEHQPRHMSNAATVFGGMGKLDRADTTRQASGSLLPAKLRIVLQTLSISTAYLRTVEATLDFALVSRRIGSSRLQVPNASATRPNGSRVNRGQIVRKMRGKSLVDLMRKARALDVISIVDEVRSVREALTEILFSSGFIPELFQSADDFLKSNRFLSKSFACVRSTLKGRTAHRRQS